MEQRDYVRRLLDAYRATPGICGAVRRADRALAAQLHQRGVPLEAVENAFVLAAARRRRASGSNPLVGILLAGDRRSTATASRPGIFSAPAPQTPTCRFGAVASPCPETKSPSAQRASGAADIAPPPSIDTTGTPAAWMMMSAPSPNPVPGVGHFNRTLLGHFWRAAKEYPPGRSITHCF